MGKVNIVWVRRKVRRRVNAVFLGRRGERVGWGAGIGVGRGIVGGIGDEGVGGARRRRGSAGGHSGDAEDVPSSRARSTSRSLQPGSIMFRTDLNPQRTNPIWIPEALLPFLESFVVVTELSSLYAES